METWQNRLGSWARWWTNATHVSDHQPHPPCITEFYTSLLAVYGVLCLREALLQVCGLLVDDEGEAARLARVGVNLQVDGLDLAELAEVLRQLLLASLPAQAAHEQLLLTLGTCNII